MSAPDGSTAMARAIRGAPASSRQRPRSIPAAALPAATTRVRGSAGSRSGRAASARRTLDSASTARRPAVHADIASARRLPSERIVFGFVGRVARRGHAARVDVHRALGLLVLVLARHAQARERHRVEAPADDFAAAFLALAVFAGVDAMERVFDELELFALAVAEQEVDLPVALVARDIVGVAAFSGLALATFFHVFLNDAQDLLAHFEKLKLELVAVAFSHFPTPVAPCRAKGGTP